MEHSNYSRIRLMFSSQGSSDDNGDSELETLVKRHRSTEPGKLANSVLRTQHGRATTDDIPKNQGERETKQTTMPRNGAWTKIDLSWVGPEALKECGEEFEERPAYVIVLRCLTKEEIEPLIDRTRAIRDGILRKRLQACQPDEEQ